jgi:hypothetical protein
MELGRLPGDEVAVQIGFNVMQQPLDRRFAIGTPSSADGIRYAPRLEVSRRVDLRLHQEEINGSALQIRYVEVT